MRSYRLALITIAFAGMLAGCAGGGSALQPQLVPMNVRSHAPMGRSWISPAAKNNDLLYVSDLIAQVVDIYTYKDHALVGTITGFFNPEGLCSDAAGNVYVTNDTSEGVHQITEYAHGSTTALRTINDPDGRANGCSVDPKTGDLAVADFWGPSEGIGNVAVWHNATGTPVSYSNPNIWYYYYCGYDNKGNLFVDGETQGSVFGLGEVKRGGSKLGFINVNETIYLPGGVQWDGKYLAVGDQVAVKRNFTSTIYQFAIKGSTGTEVSAMVLTSSSYVTQFFIPFVDASKKHKQGTLLIGPNQNGASTMIWDYPAGGDPIQTISGETAPIGVTVSLAKR